MPAPMVVHFNATSLSTVIGMAELSGRIGLVFKLRSCPMNEHEL